MANAQMEYEFDQAAKAEQYRTDAYARHQQYQRDQFSGGLGAPVFNYAAAEREDERRAGFSAPTTSILSRQTFNADGSIATQAREVQSGQADRIASARELGTQAGNFNNRVGTSEPQPHNTNTFLNWAQEQASAPEP